MRKEFVKVPVMSYEIVPKAIYTFDELSNDAKQKAITDARKYLELYGYAWEDENNRAIESIGKALNCGHKIDTFDNLSFRIYFTSKNDDSIDELEGEKAKAYIKNIIDNFDAKYYMEMCLKDTFDKYNFHRQTVLDFIDAVAFALSNDITKDYMYQYSQEGIRQMFIDNEQEFFEDGSKFVLTNTVKYANIKA